uniref:Reverse transcriptase zinc-binding domain-containing protein n=1 Tax=Arundo donax TaxID=35708 RepID=A0A0A9CVB5_ARUDO
MFAISITTQVGNGHNTLFWTDHWLNGCSLAVLAPDLIASIPKKIIRRRTVAEALHDRAWVRDIQGALSLAELNEYLQVWDALEEILLTQEEDQHFWKHEASGKYYSKSAYNTFFLGSVSFEPWRRLWKSWAPAKCKMFLWLAIRNICWTADRLEKRGLRHLECCPLCDQENETVQHLLTTCVFARQVWHKIFEPLGLLTLVPRRSEKCFADWWRKSVRKGRKEQRKGLNTLIILGAWVIWKHRNSCVFNGTSPSLQMVLNEFDSEHHLWGLAGARDWSPLVGEGVKIR